MSVFIIPLALTFQARSSLMLLWLFICLPACLLPLLHLAKGSWIINFVICFPDCKLPFLWSHKHSINVCLEVEGETGMEEGRGRERKRTQERKKWCQLSVTHQLTLQLNILRHLGSVQVLGHGTPGAFYSHRKEITIDYLGPTCLCPSLLWPAISESMIVDSKGKVSSTFQAISVSRPNNAKVEQKEGEKSRVIWEKKLVSMILPDDSSLPLVLGTSVPDAPFQK